MSPFGARLLLVLSVCVGAALSTIPARALDLPATMTITLHGSGGETIQIGKVELAQRDRGLATRVVLDDSKFVDKFLSMRPFQCLPHPRQVVCHLPYPYENRRLISKDDLTDLEYDLLFLHKTPEEYGIDAWNGMYFEMRLTEQGIVGELRETDLNVLAAPPEDGNLRPIMRSDLHPPSDKHWPRRLTIE